MISRRGLLAGLAGLGMGAAARPNIVFILVDDLRFDELRCAGHPVMESPHADRLAREGAHFQNAFAVTPLCSPSRSSFLTGLYPHRSGIVDNTNRAEQSHKLVTWPRLLHDAGYRTGFLGKWHMGNDDAPRPGFDHWVSFRGQGECVDPVLNVNGKAGRTKGYITDLLTGHAVDFLRQREGVPFCLYLAHKAVHPNVKQRDDGSVVGIGGGAIDTAENFIPAARHAKLYEGARLPRRGNYLVPPKDKPALQQAIEGLPPLSAKTAADDAMILNRMRMAKAVDEGLGEILRTLEEMKQLDNTVVVFTSDHGYFYGEHCLNAERRLAYEETIRIPLLIRYPAVFGAGVKRRDFALNIDMGPTMLELAGVRNGPAMQGVSLARPAGRQDFLIEYYSDTVFPRIRKMGYRAIRTRKWKYIQYQELEGADELYDLERDPWELKNRIGERGAQEELGVLRKRLGELVG